MRVLNTMEERILRFKQMVEQAPENELARFSLGKALFDTEQYAEALGHFEVAIAKRPDWMAVQILIGKCHLYQGDRDKARQVLERARMLALEQRHEGPLAETEQLLADLQE
jgi:uncharacterized protein HemY